MAALQTTSPVRKGSVPWNTWVAASIGALLASCGSGGGGSGTIVDPSGEFIVLRSAPPNNGNLFLNEPISVDFSNGVNIKTASFDAISFAVSDLNGIPLTEPVAGTFHLLASPGDAQAGRRLQFRPTFPKSDTFDDGGLKPGRIYRVQLVEGNRHTGLGLRDLADRGLDRPLSSSFSTAAGTTPSQLFRDTKAGGPHRSGLTITPRDPGTGEVPLNELGQQGVEIRLMFDQPLNPSSANVPVRLDLDPVNRDESKRGRIFLVYDGRSGKNIWIPAEVDLERNDLDGATVVLRPVGILPNNATIRIIVESTLEDMSGESNVNDAAYERVFGSFQTDASYELRFDAVVEDFTDASRLDLEAPFLEPLAEVIPGAIRGNFDFEGKDTNLRYEPTTPVVILNTDFTQITPKGAPKFNVTGGVFEFRSVTIPVGVTIRGTGSKPMVWLVLEDFVVKGRLLCEGGQGQSVNAISSANVPSPGGVGVCGGGNGGQGSPNTAGRSPRGETGFGPGQVPGCGGEGGQIACVSGCTNGSGGGGGSFATKGDPWFKAKASGTTFPQQNGNGGPGCPNRSLPGGRPGSLAFRDGRVDNDFWGSAVSVWRQQRITGELEKPIGGQGGGGGGDQSITGCANNPNWANDQKGAGGGGGGGVIIIKALGSIKVDRTGLISVAGGNGGGGAWAGSNIVAGGGGGGSGGMIVLMAGRSIDLVVHGADNVSQIGQATYAGNNFDFGLSADGGVGLLTAFTGSITSKYVPFPNANARNRPTGGMGGMGVIQLMAPPGSPGTANVDGTNTVLDDNINFLVGSLASGERVTDQNKMALLAWRGIPDENGILRDDNGVIVDIGDNDGDMRPSPVLMPPAFGPRSRMRGKWQDRGVVVRHMTTTGGDGVAGGVNVQPGMKVNDDFGPQQFFAATDVSSPASARYGFIAYEDDGQGGVRIKHSTVASGSIAAAKASAVHKGQSVYEVHLTQSVLGSQQDRYAHYAAQLLAGSTVRGEFRILGHDASTLYLQTDNQLSADDSLPGDITSVRVLDKFFYVFTGNVQGFPETYVDGAGARTPTANIQIGFAFHRDPARPDLSTSGEDQNRFPKRLGTFLYDMNSPAAVEAIRSQHMRYVRWDLLFDTVFESNPRVPTQRSLGPRTKRPELRTLIIPHRF
ncbi:MAG: Ig-like domain-containing domain [Planctomycetota bacterium]|jgi:hypothetical protein